MRIQVIWRKEEGWNGVGIVDGLLKTVVNASYRVEIEGLSKLDFSKPVILAPNHVSILDAVLLACNLPKEVCYVVNTDIAKKYASFLSQRKFITVDPFNSYSIRKIVREVKTGVPLVLFPEGRITTTGGIMKIYSGLGYIALRTGATIYPVTLLGVERTPFSYITDKWKTKLFPKVRIRIGEPYTIPVEAGVSKRIQKEKAGSLVLRTMQTELFYSKEKHHVQLFNEMLDACRLNGPNRMIGEELTQSITYKKLAISSYALGNKLQALVRNEQRIGTLLPTSLGHAVALFSLFYLDKSVALLNFSMGVQTVLDACETASISIILTSREFIQKANLQPMADALEKHIQVIYLEDVKASISTTDKVKAMFAYMSNQRALKENSKQESELILFTSGSESKPKGVVLTHSNIYNNIQQVLSMMDMTSKDKFLNTLPMFHSFGLTVGTILPIVTGIPVFFYPSPLHYKVIPEIAYDRNCTVLFGTSTFLAGYAHTAKPYDFYAMRHVVAGAEKLKEEVRQLWMDKFGIRVMEGYGTTEASPILSLNTPLQHKKGTVGQFLPGIRYELEKIEGISEGGNLWVDGANVMKGYLFHGKGFEPREGYYDCGDIVTVDDEGYISIVARKKRFAKIAGEMVSLNLVEQLVTEVAQDTRLAAVTTGDPRKGERIYLFTSIPITMREIKEYVLAKGFSALLVPSKIVEIEELPLLGSGKVDYVTLKQWAEQGNPSNR